MFFIAFQQQELLNNLQTAQTALHPKIDLPPSTFSKIVDFIFDVFGEGLVTDLKNRRIFLFFVDFWAYGIPLFLNLEYEFLNMEDINNYLDEYLTLKN